MTQQLIFDLKPLLRESYLSMRAFPPPRFVNPDICGNALLQTLLKTCRTLSCLRLPDALIDLEVSENLPVSNPTRSNPCLCGKPRRKQPWGTPVKVKLLLTPRQSRGNSQLC